MILTAISGQNEHKVTRLPKEFDRNLEPPCIFQKVESFIRYALPRHWFEIFIAIIAVIYVCYRAKTLGVLDFHVYFPSNSSAEGVSNLADWLTVLQALLGVPTFVVALAIWFGEIRKDWENDLPKLLSVFFFHMGKPVVACRYVWLVGPDELRTWGQQVAKQAAGNENLNFSPDVEALKPAKIIGPNGNICMHYAVCFRLTGLGSFLKEHPGMCYYQNFAAGDANVYPISSDQIEKLQVIRDWQKLLEVDSAEL